MFRSVEVRWFFRGELPDEMRGWFGAAALGTREPERVDDYLVLPDCATTSLKLRAGRLEIKALTQAPQPVSYPNEISGLRDAWVKWSSVATDDDGLRGLIVRAEDHWISISKARHLRMFSLESGQPVEVATDCGWLSGGCQVELTALKALPGPSYAVEAIPWWSLSFEAFGDPEAMQDGLDRVAGDLLREPPPVKLSRESSYSYPVWLQGLH